jgi:hypothetical protein
MSGGGGTQQTASNPWAPAVPYLQDIMGKGKSLYDSTAPSFTNPAGNFGYNPTTGAVGSIINGTGNLGQLSDTTQAGTGTAINNALTGQPDYTAVQKAIGGANQQQWDDFYNQVVPQLNQRASFLGNPSGAIKDMNSAVTNIARNQSANADQAYLGTYNAAQDRALQAAGLGGQFATGAGAQTLQGVSLYPELATMPQQNLQEYANLLNTTASPYKTVASSIKPGSGQGAANVLGGVISGAGLLGQLFGNGTSGGGSGVVGAIRNYFGGGSSAGGASGIGASGGSLAGVGGTGAGAGITGIGDAGAADIAAAGAQPIGAGLAGAGGADVAGAGAAGAGAGAGETAALGGQVASGAQTAGIVPEYAGYTTIGTDASGGGLAAGGAAEGGSDAAAAGAGSLGAGLAGAAGVAGIAAFGASRQPYDLKAKYWENVTNALTKGVSGNATYDKATPPAMQKYAAQNELYSTLQKAGVGGNLTSSDFGKGGNAIPPNVLALAKQYGMLNADGSLNKGWSVKAPVAPRYTGFGQLVPLSTNTYYDPSMLGASGSQAGPGGRAF